MKFFLSVCLMLALCLGLSDKVQASGCRQVAVVAPGVGQLNYGGVQAIQAGGCYSGAAQLNLGGYGGVQPIVLGVNAGYGVGVQPVVLRQNFGGYGVPQAVVLRQRGIVYGGGVQQVVVRPFFVPGQPVRNLLRAVFN